MGKLAVKTKLLLQRGHWTEVETCNLTMATFIFKLLFLTWWWYSQLMLMRPVSRQLSKTGNELHCHRFREFNLMFFLLELGLFKKKKEHSFSPENVGAFKELQSSRASLGSAASYFGNGNENMNLWYLDGKLNTATWKNMFAGFFWIPRMSSWQTKNSELLKGKLHCMLL